ncbi:MAG: nuclear transport factor 2 family protein [Flavisolibacter sp.]|nr:nuclear transport factor 2 family protein [Flavisolibacter sp.]
MEPEILLFKLKEAFNTHNIEWLVDCFHVEYNSEQPVHPARSFQGQELVQKNWTSNFEEMPDFSAQLLRYAINNNAVWAEWEWHGTRKDKTKLHMLGVTIFGVADGKIKWGRLYMEPVSVSGAGIEAAVKEVMHGKKTQ